MVERFEADYFAKRKRTPQSETTWKSDYQKVFSKLPLKKPLTTNELEQAVRQTEPDSRTRKRYCMVLKALADFAELQVDFSSLKGKYSATNPAPREIPSDAEIAAWRLKITNPQWRRVYGLIATYGLRNHEVFKCSFERFPRLMVLEETKTGTRTVWPLYPEWADRWDLEGELPVVTGKTNSDLGHRVTTAMKRAGVPFPPYNLRHAWVIRSISFGLDVSLAAQQMGHSVQVHTAIYHAWITEDVHDRAMTRLLAHPDRPQAPDDE